LAASEKTDTIARHGSNYGRVVIFAEHTGRPDGPAMLLVHGLLSSNSQWDANRDALGNKLRLIMVELIGHGRSPMSRDGRDYGPDRLLAEIDRVRAEADIEQWWVCGQSLGGAVVLRYALAFPHRVLGIIFTNSRAAFGVGRRHAGADSQTRSDRAPSTKPVTTRELPIHPIHASRVPPALKGRLVAAADAVELPVVGHFGRQLDGWRSVDKLAELRVPVLLVNGRWETGFRAHVDEARAAIKHLEVVDLEGGHAINIEQPEGFNDAVLDFVARHMPT
jgi:pimeloyl-ACP methyl ester carboxylesterase